MTRNDIELMARVIRRLPEQTTRDEVARVFAEWVANVNARIKPERFIAAATRKDEES